MCLWGCHWTWQAEADRSTSNWKNKTFFPSKGVVHFWEQIQILYLSLVSILIRSEQDKSVCVYAVVGVGLGGVLKFWQTRYWMPKAKPHRHIPTFLFTWQKEQEKNSKKKGLIQPLGRVDSEMQIWLKFLFKMKDFSYEEQCSKVKNIELSGWPWLLLCVPPWAFLSHHWAGPGAWTPLRNLAWSLQLSRGRRRAPLSLPRGSNHCGINEKKLCWFFFLMLIVVKLLGTKERRGKWKNWRKGQALR